MTRAMFATVIYRIAEQPAVAGADSFTDTEDGTWYSDAIAWASAQGVVEGYSDTVFGVNDPITREQLVTMLYRYTEKPAVGTAQAFADQAGISAWAEDAVQ